MTDYKIGFIFPGQGSQYVGMGKELSQSFQKVRETYQEASEILQMDVNKISFEGPDEILRLTYNTQPAILTLSISITRILDERKVKPEMAAGHSLGEYSALVCACAISFADALKLVRKRGLYMQEAVPVGIGGMAAVIGLNENAVRDVCKEISNNNNIVEIANLNSPDQTVIAGHSLAVDKAIEVISKMGTTKTVKLPVSAPFHSSLMKPAMERFYDDLNRIRFDNPVIPVIKNIDTNPLISAGEIVDSLARQIISPVMWYPAIKRMIGEGINLLVEVGPGKVLTNLAKRTDKSIQCINVEDSKSLDKLAYLLQSCKNN